MKRIIRHRREFYHRLAAKYHPGKPGKKKPSPRLYHLRWKFPPRLRHTNTLTRIINIAHVTAPVHFNLFNFFHRINRLNVPISEGKTFKPVLPARPGTVYLFQRQEWRWPAGAGLQIQKSCRMTGIYRLLENRKEKMTAAGITGTPAATRRSIPVTKHLEPFPPRQRLQPPGNERPLPLPTRNDPHPQSSQMEEKERIKRESQKLLVDEIMGNRQSSIGRKTLMVFPARPKGIPWPGNKQNRIKKTGAGAAGINQAASVVLYHARPPVTTAPGTAAANRAVNAADPLISRTPGTEEHQKIRQSLPAPEPAIDLERLTERVAVMLERKIILEKERRG
jgi:hypothetical protein